MEDFKKAWNGLVDGPVWALVTLALLAPVIPFVLGAALVHKGIKGSRS